MFYIHNNVLDDYNYFEAQRELVNQVQETINRDTFGGSQ